MLMNEEKIDHYLQENHDVGTTCQAYSVVVRSYNLCHNLPIGVILRQALNHRLKISAFITKET